ncbi:hypothetical protein Nepgr_005545 [Nepenthes gracilis]|uniref:CASP-like protein n=1 Tax=Nepenthes gracilis TaxID=150966 RepID=A0AAD3XGP8_NEPGR|nr:hypothetical protein Nepgr_005545 [Nepenthes gracilis]
MGIELPETKGASASPALETATMSGPLVPSMSSFWRPGRKIRPPIDIFHAVLRLLCLFTSATGLSLMLTAKETSTITLYGFQLPVYSKWSFSDSFEYLVGVSAAVVAHSLLQLLISLLRLLKKAPSIPSRNYAWLIFAGDQVFAYAMMSAGSAAAGVTNLNRTGIRHSPLPNFCRPLHRFCDRVAASIAFTLLSCFLLAVSAVADVVWLSNS